MINVSSTNYTDSSTVHVLMSEEHFAWMWLHVLLLLLVMVVGVPGNMLVIGVFFKSQKRKKLKSTQLLVLALAVTDLTVCTLLVPFDLYKLRHYFSLRKETLCDVFEYIRTSSMSLSCFLLTAMAVERHRAICSSTALRDNDHHPTILIITVLVISAVVFSLPVVFFLGIQGRVVPPLLIGTFSKEVQSAYDGFSGRVLVFSCEYLDEHDHTLGLRLFGLSSLLFFVGLIITSIVSYGKIYHKIRQNHISLRIALNKVAPMPPTPVLPSPRDGDTKLNVQPSTNHASTRVGIFTVASCSNGEKIRSRSEPKNHRQPQTLSTVVHEEPASVSYSDLCSDENDIAVTVENKNDVMSVLDNDLRRRGLAEVLHEVQSSDNQDFGLDGNDFTVNATRSEKEAESSPSEAKNIHVGGAADEHLQRTRQSTWSESKLSSGATSFCNIFIVKRCNSVTSDLQESREKVTAGKLKRARKRGKRAQDKLAHELKCRLVTCCNPKPQLSIKHCANVTRSCPELLEEQEWNHSILDSTTADSGCGCKRDSRTNGSSRVSNRPLPLQSPVKDFNKLAVPPPNLQSKSQIPGNISSNDVSGNRQTRSVTLSSTLAPPTNEVVPQSTPAPSSAGVVTSQRLLDPHSLRFSRQIRVAKILLMVTGAFLLCFLPFWILTLVYMVWPHLNWRLSPVQQMFTSMLYQSYFVNNAVNPVLFAFYSPEFRKECGALFRGLKGKLYKNSP